MPTMPFTGERINSGLGRAIDEAARAAGLNFSQVAIVASHLFEKIADRVAMGELVTVPGFGQFQPWATVIKGTGEPYVQPRFTAATGFRAQVKVSCMVCKACNMQAEYYRRNHTLRHARPLPAERTFTAQAAFRDRILAQARRNLEATAI